MILLTIDIRKNNSTMKKNAEYAAQNDLWSVSVMRKYVLSKSRPNYVIHKV